MSETNLASVELPLRAAQYVRMSTDQQQYSIQNQSDAIQRYAEAHSMEVIRTYGDAGRSGLTLRNRKGLQDLIRDVESGRADYSVVLVYDVSRWGRFQDTDESAYYEFICKRAKIQVHYCAEPFSNDESISSALLKTIKRTMAGEYSRELSVKVFAGKARLIEMGFRQGGHAGYGLRRLLVDRDGNQKGILKYGERKSLFTDRVILIPGPPEEVEVVNEIYRRYTAQRQSCDTIADVLNKRPVLTEQGGRWTRSIVFNILTNPKYIGANVTNRRSGKFNGVPVKNPQRMWIRKVDAFVPIVSTDLFREAQETLRFRTQQLTDEELLDLLRQLWKKHGYLSNRLLDEIDGVPSRTRYFDRFGGLLRAYQLIGYDPGDNFTYVKDQKLLTERRGEFLKTVIADLVGVGATVVQDSQSGTLIVNDELSLSFRVVRCRETKYRGYRWQFRLDPAREDFTIAARMAPGNEVILDYYVFPCIDLLGPDFDLGPTNSVLTDVYRFDDLSLVKGLCRRSRVKGFYDTATD